MNKKELTLEATMENMDEVLSFVDDQLLYYNCPQRVQFPIDVAVEELYTNIASYAYSPETGPATVRVEVLEKPITGCPTIRWPRRIRILMRRSRIVPSAASGSLWSRTAWTM